MKMTPEAFISLQTLFVARGLLPPDPRTIRAYEAAGLSARRYRWDMFWTLSAVARRDWFDEFQIYAEMNDDHIDTALRRLFPASWSKAAGPSAGEPDWTEQT